MTLSTIRGTIQAWVYSVVTPVTVIWLDPNAPRPTTGYVGIRLSAISKVGGGSHISGLTPDEPYVVTVKGDVEFILNVAGYRDSGAQAAEKLFDYLELPTVQRAISDAGIAIVGVELPLQTLPDLGPDGRFETRSLFDLRMRIGNVQTLVVDPIDVVEITVTAKRGAVDVYEKTLTLGGS
jgi:hypothetical protein